MTLANYFYHGLTKKYIVVFGSTFNKLMIERSEGDAKQKMIVPISYASYQKFLSRINEDPNLARKQAVSLPRMAFEITSMQYDGTRKVSAINKIRRSVAAPDNSTTDYVYTPAPYDLEFNLYIAVKHNEDGTKIIEQILPMFTPADVPSVKLLPDMDPVDVPIILNSVSQEDQYEGDYETRRTVLWTLSFTMKAFFYGPIKKRKLIKFVDVRLHDSLTTDVPFEKITIQPGLTIDGDPTTDINETIPYEDIKIDDDWGVITITEEYGE